MCRSDPFPRPATRPSRATMVRASLAVMGAAIGAGCATTSRLVPVPMVEAEGIAAALGREAAIDAPRQLVFDWSLTEPGARLRGIGVARVEPPHRARLDLYLENGEQVAVAVLVGDERVVLQGGRAELPPTPLLWGALGVFRPGPGAALREGAVGPDGPGELRYRLGDSDVVYRLGDGRIESVQVTRGSRVREELRLVHSVGYDFPSHANYRDLELVRELTITLETVEDAEPFPPEIWDPTS